MVVFFENYRQKVLIVRHTPEKSLKHEILPELHKKKPLNSRYLAAFLFFATARKIRILVAYEKGFGGKIRQRVRHRNYEKEQKGL